MALSVLGWFGVGLAVLYAAIVLLMWTLTPPEPTEEDLYRQKHAAVVVLGDLGHSPRMCFHALSIARCGWKVSLVGYKQSEIMKEVTDDPNIHIVALPSPPIRRPGVPYIVYGARRAWTEHRTLYKALSDLVPGVEVVMVQNPPSIPSLGVCRWFTLWKRPGTKLVIDWHNLGFSLLALRQGKLLVTAYRAYELIFGRIAYIHLAVSKRLGLALTSNLLVNPKRIMPLYDRPFQSRVVSERDKKRLRAQFSSLLGSGQHKLVVTSTSYTPDEDLGLMLEALRQFDKDYTGSTKIEVIVTGKGPLKDAFVAEVAALDLKRVSVKTAWLSYEQYHELLAIADIGISLHRSSSGWDLPMKVVDMFGTGLPVLALNFPALRELVTDGKNGLVFDDSDELAEKLSSVLSDDSLYYKLRAGALDEAESTWEDQWNDKLGPLFGKGEWTGEESSSSDED